MKLPTSSVKAILELVGTLRDQVAEEQGAAMRRLEDLCDELGIDRFGSDAELSHAVCHVASGINHLKADLEAMTKNRDEAGMKCLTLMAKLAKLEESPAPRLSPLQQAQATTDPLSWLPPPSPALKPGGEVKP
jgi:hypothetical protein